MQFQRRDKVLLFRLTQDEYDRLLIACHERGGRSLSDFVRTQLLLRIEGDGDSGLYQVNQRLSQLQSSVNDVTSLLESIVQERASK
jgi:hypothetical protein